MLSEELLTDMHGSFTEGSHLIEAPADPGHAGRPQRAAAQPGNDARQDVGGGGIPGEASRPCALGQPLHAVAERVQTHHQHRAMPQPPAQVAFQALVRMQVHLRSARFSIHSAAQPRRGLMHDILAAKALAFYAS